MNADHKAASWYARIKVPQNHTERANLAAAYLELRELAKADLAESLLDLEYSSTARKALRKALEE